MICPRSVHPETRRHYEWVVGPCEAAIAPIPEQLLHLLQPPAYERRPCASIRLAGSSQDVALRILAEERDRIAGAGVGTRNMTSFARAAAVGNLVAGGEIILAVAAHALLEAAMASGLPHCEAERVIANGLEEGIATPRSLTLRSRR